MNSHQSLAEALEMCKYTENFTSHGARRCSRRNPPRTHPTATKDPRPRTVASLGILLKRNSPALPWHKPRPRIKEHNTTYSCVYQQFTTCNRETQSSTVHKSCRSIRPRERSRQKKKCCAMDGEKKRSVQETSARLTHKQIYTWYNL